MDKLEKLERQKFIIENKITETKTSSHGFYCDMCGKFYPKKKCKIVEVFEDGGFYDCTLSICPKKHDTIIDD
ncbi:MAG TPA: hypothetical protein HA230_04425 [Candidatus Aenigmarchaeota archaeon]|nr:hypothetical protein [Candidatus Aenigmarchaeota archaeon]